LPVDMFIISLDERASVQLKRRASGGWSAHEDWLIRPKVAGPKRPNGVQLLGLIWALLAVAPELERSGRYAPREWLEHSHLQP
jgi:hypothetical protein